jgi:hypothetical protein
MKNFAQNNTATRFMLPYNDDGVFKMRIFGRDTRSEAEIAATEVNFNQLLGLDDWTMCLTVSPDPFVICCFITDDIGFVNLYHSFSHMHYHFFLNLNSKEIVGEVVKQEISNFSSNFPLKCFYNDDDHEIYSFYRQGEAFIIKEG